MTDAKLYFVWFGFTATDDGLLPSSASSDGSYNLNENAHLSVDRDASAGAPSSKRARIGAQDQADDKDDLIQTLGDNASPSVAALSVREESVGTGLRAAHGRMDERSLFLDAHVLSRYNEGTGTSEWIYPNPAIIQQAYGHVAPGPSAARR